MSRACTNLAHSRKVFCFFDTVDSKAAALFFVPLASGVVELPSPLSGDLDNSDLPSAAEAEAEAFGVSLLEG